MLAPACCSQFQWPEPTRRATSPVAKIAGAGPMWAIEEWLSGRSLAGDSAT